MARRDDGPDGGVILTFLPIVLKRTRTRRLAALAGLLALCACAAPQVRRGNAACVVRGLSMPTPRFDEPNAGEGYAMEALPGAYDLDQARAACAESVYERLTGVYAAAGNLEPASWEVVVYDAYGRPVASDLSRFGGGLPDDTEGREK